MFGANGIVTNGGWLTRGYTGHEHVPQVDLINMNGRMYDAVLGRMLSPDNFVGNPTSTQSYNRYSYVENNPLKYTDPSGWFLKAREEGREIAFPDVPHKGEEYGGCPGGFFNSSIFNYNFQGSYSSYVSNQGYYSFIYGTQTGMQAAVQAGYVQSKINLALSILSYSSKWQWTGRSGNEGSAGEQKQRNINRTWTFGGDGGSSSGIDWSTATASNGNGFTIFGWKPFVEYEGRVSLGFQVAEGATILGQKLGFDLDGYSVTLLQIKGINSDAKIYNAFSVAYNQDKPNYKVQQNVGFSLGIGGIEAKREGTQLWGGGFQWQKPKVGSSFFKFPSMGNLLKVNSSMKIEQDLNVDKTKTLIDIGAKIKGFLGYEIKLKIGLTK